MATLTNLINRVIVRLSLVPGSSTQLYAEDRIGEMIQHKFDVLFTEEFWPQFNKWRTSTLDGTLGIVTEDLSAITFPLKEFADIRVIFLEGRSTKLTKMPTLVNPDTLTGVTPMFYEGFQGTDTLTVAQRVFQIRPLTATGQITYSYRNKPDDFVAADTVDFDIQALILGAAWDYLEDDGTNPGATDKMQGMFEARVNQIKTELHSGPIPLDVSATNPSQFEFTEL